MEPRILAVIAIILIIVLCPGVALGQEVSAYSDDGGQETVQPEEPLPVQPEEEPQPEQPEEPAEQPTGEPQPEQPIEEPEEGGGDEQTEQPDGEVIETPDNEEDAASPGNDEEEIIEEEPEPEEEVVSEYGYIVLEDGVSAVVMDFEQLVSAITMDNGIVNVYLGTDVTIERNRVEIPASKTEFLLSGTDPRTGVRHTITELNTTGLANIVVANSNKATRRVTMADMTIVNRGDYYGLIGVEDGNVGVEMVVRNVDFSGRQFAYNLYGHLIFEGTNNINILASVNGAGGQELAEVQHVTVRGALNVDFQSTYHVFRMDMGAARFVVEGSLTVNAPSVYETYGIINSGLGENAVDIELAPGANMSVTANTRLVDAVANNLTVGAGATFRFDKTGGLTGEAYPAIGLRKNLTVGEGATFYLRESANGASYPIRFYDVPSSMSGGVMEFNNPNQVTLINEGSRAMVHGVKKEEFNVRTQYLDYWTSGQPLGGEATYRFDRTGTDGGQDISINMVHRAGNPVSLNTNHSGITMDILKLDASAKQIVFGQGGQTPPDPEPETSTIRFEGRYAESNGVISDFAMEDIIVEKGVEVSITPQEILGYVATGYSVNGGSMQQLQDGMAVITPEAGEVYVTFYYSEPVLEVTVPVKMVFTAYESDGGSVSSAQYSFLNKSDFDVDVSLTTVADMQPDVENDLWLYMNPIDSGTYNAVDIVGTGGGDGYIGQLTGQGGSMEFTLDGQYYGDFNGEPKWPAYKLGFSFGISGKGDSGI